MLRPLYESSKVVAQKMTIAVRKFLNVLSKSWLYELFMFGSGIEVTD